MGWVINSQECTNGNMPHADYVTEPLRRIIEKNTGPIG